jgi:hypothetical protein
LEFESINPKLALGKLILENKIPILIMNIPSKNALTLMEQLNSLAKGINRNKQTWPLTNAPSDEDIKEITGELNKMITSIIEKEHELSRKRIELHKFMNENAKVMYVRVRDQIYSIHGKRSEKLKDFDLKKLK